MSNKSYEELEKELLEGNDEKEIDVYDDKMGEEDIDSLEDLSAGLTPAEYDIDSEFKSEFDEMVELKNRKGLEIKYSFNGEEIKEALKIFQRETIYRRNLIYTGIFAAIFVLYLVSMFMDKSSQFSMFLAIVCIACICFIWYAPYSHIKKTAKAADSHELNFTMVIYDDCVKIGEEEASFVLNFNKEINKIFETPSQFLLCVGKERVFLVPKRFLGDGVTTQMKEIFSEAMQANYIKKF